MTARVEQQETVIHRDAGRHHVPKVTKAKDGARSGTRVVPNERWWMLGVVSLGTFMLMLDLSVIAVALRIPTFIGMSLVALMANGAGLPSIFLDTTYVQGVLGSTAWGAGVQFMPLTLTLFVSGAAAGALIGRISFRWLMFTACAALGAGLLSTQLAGAETSWTALIPSMVLTGIGLGLFNPVRAALAISVTEPEKAGVASGINEMICQVGTALGIAGVGALFQSRVTEEFVNSGVGAQLGTAAADVAGTISAGAVELAASAASPTNAGMLTVLS